MERRTMLQWSSIYAMGIPILPSIGLGFGYSAPWRGWLQTLKDHCEIESVQALFFPDPLPKDALADFSSATNTYYFYNQRQYCFTVFEKYHPVVGLLELALPFWRLQSDGSWEKVACLSLFQLEALAKASVALAKIVDEGVGNHLLPNDLTITESAGYKTTTGAVRMKSRVQTAAVVTAIQVESKQSVIWQETFESAHCLTCQS